MSNISIFSTGSWISTVWDAGAASTQSTGIMGAMQGAKKYKAGSIKAFFANNAVAATSLATIAQTGVTDLTTLAMQAGDLAAQKRAEEKAKLAEKLAPTPPAPPVALDPVIYFEDGSTLDTVNNVITMVTGKKIDAITGADWIDPAYIVNLANGSYLDTYNNILTLADGTKIDTVTGLVISVTA
jgi:hypothetical protein